MQHFGVYLALVMKCDRHKLYLNVVCCKNKNHPPNIRKGSIGFVAFLKTHIKVHLILLACYNNWVRVDAMHAYILRFRLLMYFGMLQFKTD